MATPKTTVTQAQVRRHLRAVREAGYDEGRVEIEWPDGTGISVVGKVGEAGDDPDDIDAMIDKVPNAPTS